MADETKYTIDLNALERFKDNIDKTVMMTVVPTEFDFGNHPTVEMTSNDLAKIIENRPGKLLLDVSDENEGEATIAFDLAIAVNEHKSSETSLLYTGKLVDGEEEKVYNILLIVMREDGEDGCTIQTYEESGGGGDDDPTKKQIWTYDGILSSGVTNEWLIGLGDYSFSVWDYSPKGRTYYYYDNSVSGIELPLGDLTVQWDGNQYTLPYVSSEDTSRYYGEMVNDEFEFNTYPCGIVLTDEGSGNWQVMVFTDDASEEHNVEVYGQTGDPSQKVLLFSNGESYYNVYNAIDDGHTIVLKIYDSITGDTIWLPNCEYVSGGKYNFYGKRDSGNEVKVSVTDSQGWLYAESSDSENYATTSDIDDIFNPPTPPAPTIYSVSSAVSAGISASSIPPSINAGDTFYVTWSVDSGYSFLMSYVEMGGVDVTSQYATSSSIVIPNVTGNIYLEITAQSDSPGNTHSISYDTMNFNVVFDGYNYPPSSIADGASLSGRLDYDSTYTLQSFSISMGGNDITQDVFDWGSEEFTINSVTGDLVFEGYAEQEMVTTWPVHYIWNGVTTKDDMPSDIAEGDSLDISVTPFAYGNTFQAVGIYRASNNITNQSGVWTDNGDGSYHIHIEDVYDEITLIIAAGNGAESYQLTNSIAGNGHWVSGYAPSSPVGIGMTPTYKFHVDDVATDWVSIVEVWMGNTEISDIAWIGEDNDGSNNCTIILPPVASDVTINIEIETDEPYEPIYDEISFNLTNCTTTSNNPEEVEEGDLFTCQLEPTGNYQNVICDSIVMGGVDITNEAWDYSTSTISIYSVTDDVVVTAHGNNNHSISFILTDVSTTYNPGTISNGSPFSCQLYADGLGEYPVVDSVAMGGIDITDSVWDDTTYTITINSVTDDVTIEAHAEEDEEEEVPIESIRYTDGQGSTCIGFNMNEGATCDLWDNLEVLPIDFTDGVEFSSSDDAAIEVDGGGTVTAVGAMGDSATITIRSMGDPSIYTTVSISISEDEPDEPEEEPEESFDFAFTNNCQDCWLDDEPDGFYLGSSWSTNVIPDSGYNLDSAGVTVSITMGGTDITSTAWTAPGASGNGSISIPNVTGDVIVTVIAAANE